MVLIGIGVLFQIFAFSAFRRERIGPSESKSKRALKRPEVKTPMNAREFQRASSLPSRGKKDYYEMEVTPPGVRPSELTKTAKVKYID
jgi:hypothetical protein